MNYYYKFLKIAICLFHAFVNVFVLCGQDESYADLELSLKHVWIIDEKTIDVEVELYNKGGDSITLLNMYTASGWYTWSFLLIGSDCDIHNIHWTQRRETGWWISQKSSVIEPGKRICRLFSITPQTWKLPSDFDARRVEEIAACFTLKKGYAHSEGKYVSQHASVHLSEVKNVTDIDSVNDEDPQLLYEELLYQLYLLADMMSNREYMDFEILRELIRQTKYVVRRIRHWEMNTRIVYYKNFILVEIDELKKDPRLRKYELLLKDLTEMLSHVPLP